MTLSRDCYLAIGAKAPSIVTRRQADQTTEDTAECGGILVSHGPSDLIDRAPGELQQLARFFHSHALGIFGRLGASRRLETAQERAVLEARFARHVGNAYSASAFDLQPMLHLQYRLVTVRQPWCKARVVTLLTPARVDKEEAAGFDHDAGAE